MASLHVQGKTSQTENGINGKKIWPPGDIKEQEKIQRNRLLILIIFERF